MIIDKLVLHNYGVYEGRHEIALRPQRGKPVTLIGALNGSGKTTLLEGIQICLFGRCSKFLQASKAAYSAYLTEAINRRRRTESAAVTVVFRSGSGAKKKTYEVTRTWGIASKGVSETLQVSVDGEFDSDVTERWPEISERFLPSQLSDLFFFDGERIEALAEPARCSQMIREGLSNLLGLDLITDLDRSLVVLDRRIRSEELSPESQKKLETLEAQRELLIQQRGGLEHEKGAVLESLETTHDQLASLRRELETQGGELLSRRDEFRAKRGSVESEINDLRSALIEQAESALPLAMLSDRLEKLAELTSSAVTPERAKQMEVSLSGVVERLIKELLDQGHINAASRSKASELGKLVVDSEMALKKTTNIDCDFQQVAMAQSGVASARNTATKLLVQLQAHLAEADRLDALLAAVPAGEKVDHLIESLHLLESQEITQQKSLSTLDEQAARLQRDFEELDAKIERVLGEQREFQAQQLLTQQMRTQLLRGREHLEVFQERMRGRHISRLEGFILDGLKTLYRKQGFVKAVRISPADYSIVLELEGEGTVPAFKLSAAERQLLAVSVLWGLAKASDRVLPTIIDTPLGRLDSKHRATFVERYFPKAAKQVILLSTDEEVVGRYYEMLKPFIANEYVLSYDEAAQSSTIEHGYFPGYKEAA
jgi:DNA sulfur modification protein DndD